MEPVRLHYEIDGTDFAAAGEASSDVKRVLRWLGVDPQIIRKASICMYEGEINLVIHGGGGVADVSVSTEWITLVITDHGPGIPDVAVAMQEGYSTAPENVRDLGFGAGMGLPNMKRYSDEMSIESEVGRGTRVFMRIRLKPEDAPEE